MAPLDIQIKPALHMAEMWTHGGIEQCNIMRWSIVFADKCIMIFLPIRTQLDEDHHLQDWGRGSLPEKDRLISSGWWWVAAPTGGVFLYLWVLFTNVGKMEHVVKRELSHLPVNLLSDNRLWAWAGHDQKNKVTNTSSRNEFPQKGDWLSLRDAVRSLVSQGDFRAELQQKEPIEVVWTYG